ncbi:MAG: hypothetical protein IPL31_10945 [Saprospiraceae bacterium]|nr:hypothetical protein [Saprospiraceae bacterium]
MSFLFSDCKKECPFLITPELNCTQKSELFLGTWDYYKVYNTYRNDSFYRKEEYLYKISFFNGSGVDSLFLGHFKWKFLCNPDTLNMTLLEGSVDSIKYFKVETISEDRIKFGGLLSKYWTVQDTYKLFVTYDLIKK